MRSLTILLVALALSACAAARPAPQLPTGVISSVYDANASYDLPKTVVRADDASEEAPPPAAAAKKAVSVTVKRQWLAEADAAQLIVVKPYSVVVALPGGWDEVGNHLLDDGSTAFILVNDIMKVSGVVIVNPMHRGRTSSGAECVYAEKEAVHQGMTTEGINFSSDGRACDGSAVNAKKLLSYRITFVPGRNDFLVDVSMTASRDVDRARLATEMTALADNTAIFQ